MNSRAKIYEDDGHVTFKLAMTCFSTSVSVMTDIQVLYGEQDQCRLYSARRGCVGRTIMVREMKATAYDIAGDIAEQNSVIW